ncbi:MAG TPA: type II/IV secretion system protein [Gammaproteobacteria bacterium]|nr:type II/IV secretion system protein [Gammaproteobacteria bacterium]
MAQAPRSIYQSDRKLSVKELLDELAADGLITAAAAAEMAFPARTHSTLEIHPLVLMSQQEWPDARHDGKLLDLDVLTRWLAERVGLPYYRIDPLKVDVTRVTAVISHAYASRHRILPVDVDETSVTIATAEPYLRSWESELRHVTGLEVKRVIANPVDVSRYLDEFFSVSRSIQRATSEESRKSGQAPADFEQLVELGEAGTIDANDQHVVHVVDWLLQYAFDQRASDIHIEPRREVAHIKFRIDGILHQVYDMPMTVINAVTSRIKILGRMDVVEKRRPQDGRIKTRAPDGTEIELRLSTMPTAFGEKLVLRIFNPEVLVKDFPALGFSAKDVARWDSMVSHPHGIVLVTGPTGSGKTTTLYSTLRRLARPELNVCTVEDPIEMVMPQFNQMQVQHNIGVDFASGVRTLLRQDPDIIMVGEIRDHETANMAIQAALTGHLVLSTLHTNDTAAAIPRLRELGIPAYLLNATLLGIMAQRLVRNLCPHCKEPTEVDAQAWQALTAPWSVSGTPTYFRAVGCDKCRQTGYLGRSGIYEIMTLEPEIRKEIGPEADADSIRRLAIRNGMTRLRLSGARKVAMGLTTIEEVMKVVPPDSEL